MHPMIDEEFAALIPAHSDEERNALEASVRESGCRDALVVWKDHGILLDGHNRLRICTENDIRFRTVEIDLPDRAAAAVWIVSNQLGRRNLNDWQRARLVLRRKEILARAAAERKQAGWKNRKAVGEDLLQNSVEDANPKPSPPVQQQLADLAGVSHDTIHKVGVIEAKGTPEMKERLDEGKISINKAYRHTIDHRHKQGTNAMRTKRNLGPCGRCSCCKAWKRQIDEERALEAKAKGLRMPVAQGATDKEIALARVTENPGATASELAPDGSGSIILKRLGELKAAGLIFTHGERLCSVTGRVARRWWPQGAKGEE